MSDLVEFLAHNRTLAAVRNLYVLVTFPWLVWTAARHIRNDRSRTERS